MITIFTVPKAFTGHFGLIQDNAIRSWLRLIPRPEVIIFGDERRFMATVKKYPVRWLPFIRKNKFGTPLLNSVFDQAQQHATGDILAYVNSDVILDQSLISSLEKVKFKKFLLIGRRWNLDIRKQLNFDNGWGGKRDKLLRRYGKLFRRDGLDYFVFPKETTWSFPPFAIGRSLWDNWIPFRAKQIKAKVIDATDSVIAIHQKHNYSHAGGLKKILEGAERKRNIALAQDKRCFFSLYDADYVLHDGRVRHKRLTVDYLWRRLETLPVFYPKTDFVVGMLIDFGKFLVEIRRKVIGK